DAALGKGFSKPDFWTKELSLPSFLAVRPLASGDFVVIKMKVAALSAALCWLLVITFLCLWLPLWANLASLNMFRLGYWMVYDHSLAPQYLIAILFIAAMILLTWRCLVGSLWVGLSGSRGLVIRSAIVHCLVGAIAIVSFVLLLVHDEAVKIILRKDPDAALSWCGW